MAHKITTFIVDWADNAGPTGIYRGAIDPDALDTDPLLQLAAEMKTTSSFITYISVYFRTNKLKDEWLTLAAIKYGLSK